MPSALRPKLAIAASLLALLTACSDDAISPHAIIAQVRVDSISALSENVLARRVHVTIEGADSAWIEFASSGGPADRTPAFRVQPGRNTLLLLGMRQGEDHQVRVVARSRAGVLTESPARAVRTDSVPQPLRALRLAVTGTATPGYTMFPIKLDTSTFIAIYDGAGDLRWYFDARGILPNGSVTEIQQLRSGGFLAHVGLTSGWQPMAGKFQWILPDGRIAGSIGAPAPLYTDDHEIVPLYTGDQLTGTILFGYDLRILDMTAFGGPARARIAGHYILRQPLTGGTDFFWSAWDHLALTDWIEEPQSFKTRENIDFDHPNALAIDQDGHYLVSWRHLAEITKIDSRSGAIIWRWGGVNNQFTMVGDTLGFFSGQHSIRVMPNGNYLLFDNGLRHTPSESRAVEYRLDPVARTATLVWQFRHQPAVYSMFQGSVQRLANGNTLINWSGNARVTEVEPSGTVAWEGTLSAAGIAPYRAYRLSSLYAADRP